MATLSDAERRARTVTREERARDAALAVQEYEALKRADAAKTERLRALRLAKEAEVAQPAPAKKKPPAARKRARRPAVAD